LKDGLVATEAGEAAAYSMVRLQDRGSFFIEPGMGSIILTVFVIIVFGGLGSIPGALISAYTVGIVHSFVSS